MFAKRTIASCLLMASLETFSFGTRTVPGSETGAPEDVGGSILNNIKTTMLLVFASLLGLLGLSHQKTNTLPKQVK